MTETMQRPLRKGEQTRAAILDAALELASREGLEGLTIGVLAERMDMSKSGVFAHFCSREDLKIAVLKLYNHQFEQEVFYPSIREQRGLPRLQSLFRRWVDKVCQRALHRAAQLAIEEQHLKPDTDPKQLVFEMYGLVLALHHDARFIRSPGSVVRAHAGFERLISSAQSNNAAG